MQNTGIHSVEDFQKAVSDHQAAFDRLSENRKAIRKLDTTLGHMDAFIRLKPIHDRSKRGFEKTKARFEEAHTEELAKFNKAVRYLKANKLNVTDREKYAAQRNALVRENEKIEEALRAANFNPALIRKMQNQIEQVLQSGEIPELRMTLQERLQQPRPEAEPQKKNERPGFEIE